MVCFRTGEIFDKDTINEPDYRWMGNMPTWCFPKKLVTLGYTQQFLDAASYTKHNCIKEVPNCTKVYNGHSVSVSRDGRGRGLGKELIRRSMDLAKNNGCSHMYIFATGIYSQAIFDQLG